MLEDIRKFKAELKPKTAILGVDYGSKRLGVAVSDLLRMVASSYGIIQRTSLPLVLASMQRVIEEKEIGGIVYGLPLQMNGEEGEMALEVRKFAASVAKQVDLPYCFWDERLSSSAAERFLIDEVDMSRKRRKEVLDASAAVFILQGFLDALGRA